MVVGRHRPILEERRGSATPPYIAKGFVPASVVPQRGAGDGFVALGNGRRDSSKIVINGSCSRHLSQRAFLQVI